MRNLKFLKIVFFMTFLMTSILHFSVESLSSSAQVGHKIELSSAKVWAADSSTCPVHSESRSPIGAIPHCVQCDAFHHCAFLSPEKIKIPLVLIPSASILSAELRVKNPNLSGLLRPPKA